MAQQLNLIDARYAPQVVRFSARQTVLGMLLVVGGAVAASQALERAAQRLQTEAEAVQQQAQPLNEALKARSGAAAPNAQAQALQTEIEQLREIEAGQHKVRAALDAGVAGATEGPSDYLVALARQASGEVWLTGIAIGENARVIELQGRMLDATALTAYLRRLNHEPLWRGRPFTRLSLGNPSGAEALPFTEFKLRTTAPLQSGP